MDFQDYLRMYLRRKGINAPRKVPKSVFEGFMKTLSNQKAKQYYLIYRNAGIRKLITNDKHNRKVRYLIYASRPEQKAEQKSRRYARNFIKNKLKINLDGYVLHHKDHNALNNDPGNWVILNEAHHRCHHQPNSKFCSVPGANFPVEKVPTVKDILRNARKHPRRR